MLILLKCSLLLVFLSRPSESKFAVELNDDFDQCSPDIPILSINTSKLVFSPIEGGSTSMHISGDLVFMEDYIAPVEVNFWSLHLERGTWVPGSIERTERDLCGKLMSPLEPWFFLVRHFHRKRCPFKAGHVETLPDVEVGNFGLELPASFAGDWKFFLQMDRRLQGRLVKQCLVLSASIVEV
ncbi:uncharacterized protein LOC109419727 [Aedes albopictus]|uniref:Secreted protein n=1 Tax=Aedes albopictus TaxID=7160 RepID=A0ABM1ZKA6_AEDAL|nr:uncharacterized protein LOC109419727 [Aedes albopictus]